MPTLFLCFIFVNLFYTEEVNLQTLGMIYFCKTIGRSYVHMKSFYFKIYKCFHLITDGCKLYRNLECR